MNHCMLMMGGNGTRVGAEIPKQYIKINGKPIFYYILNKLQKQEFIDTLIIVANEAWHEYIKETIITMKINKRYCIVNGGSNRSESIKSGLIKLSEYAKPEDIVLIHDATHPYVDTRGCKEIIKAIQKYDAVTLGAYQYDTCYLIDENNFIEKVIPREYLVSGASPEAFRFKFLSNIYLKATSEELAKMTSAGALALKYGVKMYVVPVNIFNLKITFKEDLKLLKELINSYFFSV